MYNSETNNYQLTIAEVSDAVAMAKLHGSVLRQGFLVRLGPKFLTQMYCYLIEKEVALVLKDEDGVLKGFVSASRYANGLMRRFLFSRPLSLLRLTGILLRRPTLLRSVIETAAVSSKAMLKDSDTEFLELPEVELLSICVDDSVQHQGVGSRLLDALEVHFRELEILRFKVIAGDKLDAANRFYQKHDFQRVMQITIHGSNVSNVYVKDL